MSADGENSGGYVAVSVSNSETGFTCTYQTNDSDDEKGIFILPESKAARFDLANIDIKELAKLYLQLMQKMVGYQHAGSAPSPAPNEQKSCCTSLKKMFKGVKPTIIFDVAFFLILLAHCFIDFVKNGYSEDLLYTFFSGVLVFAMKRADFKKADEVQALIEARKQRTDEQSEHRSNLYIELRDKYNAISRKLATYLSAKQNDIALEGKTEYVHLRDKNRVFVWSQIIEKYGVNISGLRNDLASKTVHEMRQSENPVVEVKRHQDGFRRFLPNFRAIPWHEFVKLVLSFFSLSRSLVFTTLSEDVRLAVSAVLVTSSLVILYDRRTAENSSAAAQVEAYKDEEQTLANLKTSVTFFKELHKEFIKNYGELDANLKVINIS